MRTQPRRGVRPANAFVPRLEPLEERALLSCVVSETGGALRITGDSHRNLIQIVDTGGVGPGSVLVNCDGRTTVTTGPVGAILVAAGGGSDFVTYDLVGPLAPKLPRAVHVTLDNGNDTFLATLHAGVQAGANLDMEVDGGTGNDTIRVNTPAGADVAPGATLRMFLVGGDDADRVGVTYMGQVQGRLLYRGEGNPGPDTVSGDVSLLAGSTGFVATEVRGGTNIDHMALLLHKQNPADPVALSGLIDGGPSFNTCLRTANVTALRCFIDRVVP